MEKALNHVKSHSASLQALLDRMEGVDSNLAAYTTHCRDHGVARPHTIEAEQVDFWKTSGFNHHCAAPQNLLRLWPTVGSLLQAASVKHDDGFVTEAENRGIPPLWIWTEELRLGDPTRPARSNKSPAYDTNSTPYTGGSMEASGEIDLHPITMNTLCDSYVRNFHIMHPFLDLTQFRNTFGRFIRTQSTEPPWHKEPSERSPSNCIVYLVLALGQISLHQQPLPGTVDRGNMDVTPGLVYYAKAAKILGDHCDGNELVHVQMFLLAGLYKGQLARVKESMSWIAMAGRAVLTLLERYKLCDAEYWYGFGDVRARLEAGQQRVKDTQQSLIVLASWCCLQLESEILADLKLPVSGIQQIEGHLCLPSKSREQAEADNESGPDDGWQDSDSILMFYNAQLWMQLRLSDVRRHLYAPDRHNRSPSDMQEMQRLDNMLSSWRACLPVGLAWHDDDPQPSGILAARLRATYWEALYLIHRPVLDYALHIMPNIALGSTVESVARDGYGNPRDEADVHLFETLEQLDTCVIWRASKRCVDACMKSVVAFDNVPGRLIVTNIRGTAHA